MQRQSKTKNRRKTFLIYPQFQLRFMSANLVSALAVISICFASNFYFFSHFEQIGIEERLPADHVFFTFISQQKQFTAILFSVVAILTIVFIVMYGVFQSHKIAGPLVRLKKYLEQEMAGGNSKPLAFRKGDYFLDLAPLINQVLKGRSNTEPQDQASWKDS